MGEMQNVVPIINAGQLKMSRNGSDFSEIIDLKEAMTRLDDDYELLEEIWDVFLEDAPNQINILEKSIREKDFMTVAHQSHSLKGAAANIGAVGTADLAGRLQRFAERKKMEDVEKIYGTLKKEMEKLISSLSDSAWRDRTLKREDRGQ